MSLGIYIKGAKMSTSCWGCEVGRAECPFYSMEFWEQEEYRDKIAEGCPLSYVPPHGRLIDADEKIKVQMYDDMTEDYYMVEMTIDDLLNQGWIEANAPTIIEAEEGKT